MNSQLEQQIRELIEQIALEKKWEEGVQLKPQPLDVKLNEVPLLRNLKDSISFTVSVRVTDTDAATTAKYGTFFVAPFPCVLVKAYERHGTAGTDASAVTLDIEKLATGTAKGSGVTMLASTFNLKGTINTYQTASPATTTGIRLAVGEAVALKPTGVLTAVNDVVVTLVFKTDLSNLPI